MQQEFSRTEILIGEEGIELLAKAKVAVFGLGGVGSYVVEALARCGVGSLILVDHDVISASNINRQLFALHSTVGQFKTEVAKARVRDIDSDILVHTYQTFYSGETAQLFDLKSCDYIVDAIDTVSSKLLLIENAKKACDAAGVTPLVLPIRGGTDGAQLSFKGLPCPNLGTGGHGYHGPYEHITAEGMDASCRIVLELIRIYAEDFPKG